MNWTRGAAGGEYGGLACRSTSGDTSAKERMMELNRVTCMMTLIPVSPCQLIYAYIIEH